MDLGLCCPPRDRYDCAESYADDGQWLARDSQTLVVHTLVEDGKLTNDRQSKTGQSVRSEAAKAVPLGQSHIAG